MLRLVANQGQPGFSTADVEVAWWHGFQDDRLDQLVTQALARNHDIRIATARLREARALLRETRFDRPPTVTAQGSYTHQQLSRAIEPASSDRSVDLFTTEFDATWELDFFGRVRRAVEASTADVGAAEASRRDVIVSLLSELARNYFELRGTQNQLAVAHRNAENQRETLELTTALLEAGRGTELDVLRAEAQLNFTLVSIPLLESSLHQAMHRLGVLIGQEPTALVTELTVPQLLPGLGQVVFDNAGLASGPGLDHAGLLQLLEALGEQGGRHARHPAAQIVEAGAAAQQLAQDQRRPARADHFRCHRNGAKLTVTVYFLHVDLPSFAQAKMLRRQAARSYYRFWTTSNDEE